MPTSIPRSHKFSTSTSTRHSKIDRQNYDLVLCLSEATNFIEIDRRTMSSDNGAKRPMYSGRYAEAYNFMGNIAFGNEKLNYTSILEDGYGALNETTGYYESGCLAALQRGRADIGTLYTDFPVVQPGLKQGGVISEDQIVILSHYTVEGDGNLIDLFSGLSLAFDYQLWLLNAALILVFWALVKCRVSAEKAKNRKNGLENHFCPNIFYQVLTHILQVESIDYEAPALKFISFLMTFMSFFILVYLGNLLNTSLVVREKPDVIESYDDLLKVPVLRTYFISLQNHYKAFESAKPGSKEYKVWQKARQHYTKEQLLTSFNSMVTVAEFMTEFSLQGKDRRSVGIVSGIIAPIARRFMCGAKVRVLTGAEDIFTKNGLGTSVSSYSFKSSDPEAKNKLIGTVYNENFTSPIAARIVKRNIHAFQAGILIHVIKLMDTPYMDHTDFNKRQHVEYKKCLLDKYEDNMNNGDDFKMIQVVQLKNTSSVCGVLIVLAFYVLIAEVIKPNIRIKPAVDPGQMNN